jgi:hypothetical protein
LGPRCSGRVTAEAGFTEPLASHASETGGPHLLQLLASTVPDGIEMSGDPAVLGRLMSLTGDPDPDYAIVTPNGEASGRTRHD